MVNTVYEAHKHLPKCLAAQADNARTNKGWLVLGFSGVYAVNGAFEEARLKFCLEDHAHDIYDVFQGFSVAVAKRFAINADFGCVWFVEPLCCQWCL